MYWTVPPAPRQRLLNQKALPRPGLRGGVPDRSLLHLRDTGRDAHDNPGLDEAPSLADLRDEIMEHLFGNIEISNDPILQGANDPYGPRSRSEERRVGKECRS